MAAGNLGDSLGPVAQLVERLHGMEEVAGSTPVGSTFRRRGFVLGGLVSGEGSYYVTRKQPPFKDGTERKRFVFTLCMAERDRALVEELRSFLGFGSIHRPPRAKPHWQPVCTLTIASIRAHVAATIPFSEEYLLPCAKRAQFERWRDELLAWERDRPSRYGKGPSPCSVEGCEKPVRGRGLCRSHYYRATGY